MNEKSKKNTIGSVRTLLDKLADLDSTGNVLYYRGHASCKFTLLPSLYREQNFCHNESRLVREILLKCPDDFKNSDTAFEMLVKMQHYGVPTRLLDVTENPLVALYFACCENIQSDINGKKVDDSGELVIFSIPKREIKYFDSDTVSVISNLAFTSDNFNVPPLLGLSNVIDTYSSLEDENRNKLLHNIKKEKPYFLDRINPYDIQRVCCVKPKLNNPRITRQSGAFLLFGIDQFKDKPASIEPNWISSGNGRSILIIPADKKKKIIEQLSQLGISAGTLFPELDSVAAFTKAQFLQQSSDKPLYHDYYKLGPAAAPRFG